MLSKKRRHCRAFKPEIRRALAIAFIERPEEQNSLQDLAREVLELPPGSLKNNGEYVKFRTAMLKRVAEQLQPFWGAYAEQASSEWPEEDLQVIRQLQEKYKYFQVKERINELADHPRRARDERSDSE